MTIESNDSNRTFRLLFLSVFFGAVLLVAAFILNSKRPVSDVHQPSASFVKATGKCAACHRMETSAILHEYEMSVHAVKGVSCLDCHQAHEGQKKQIHKGFEIAEELTAKNCAHCHSTEYDQFLRSRHAAPAWAAVTGEQDFSPEQVAFSEKFHKGAVKRALQCTRRT